MKINKSKVLRYILVVLSTILNFLFYSTMGLFFMVLGVTFDLVKSEMFEMGIKRKSKIIIIVGILFSSISLIATMGNVNNKVTIETEQVITDEWNNNQKLIEIQQNIVDKAQKNLDDMPTLDDYKGNISSLHSTNLAKITKEYNDKNEELTNIVKEENNKLIELQSKNIEKFKEIESKNQKGYILLFKNLSEVSKIDTVNLIVILGLILALLLEISIFILTKEDSEDKKELTESDILQDAVKKISLQSTQSLIDLIQNTQKNQSSDERSDKKSELQSSSSSSDEKISQSNPIFEDQMKKIGLDKSKDFDKVREVACNNDSQSLSLESKDENVNMKQTSGSDKDQIRLDKDKRSDKKIGFQTSSSDEDKKIGFELQNPKLDKIKNYLIDNKMQGKQFPVAKLTEYMNCKRYEIDDLKPLLISEKIIYKSNAKSYKVNEKLGGN